MYSLIDNYLIQQGQSPLGFQNQNQNRNKQTQIDQLRQQLAQYLLPSSNPTAFQPQTVQTLLQPNAPQIDYKRYGMGPEQMFFQPYYFNIPSAVSQSRDLQAKLDGLLK